MDELRGPNIQIILHVKEGLGFGFLRTPFIVSGSLNGYMLETDPVVPAHAPAFDAELVWEADKRKFRSLRVQNVPIKVEVFTVGTQSRKDKIGYLLLSLLGAQPCPSNKIVDVKYTWHRLLGVRSEGKCCHPQLMMSLSIEDRLHTLTPRNELRMFHSNEVAYPTSEPSSNPAVARNVLLTYNEYIEESKKTVSVPELQPKLLCDEGLIQIGDNKEQFVLSFVIGSVENLDLLLPDNDTAKDMDFYVTYSVFTHNIMTDRVGATTLNKSVSAQFNQRTSLRLAGSLGALSQYFALCPLLIARICAGDTDIGICSMDLRKLVPTEDSKQFLSQFCNTPRTLQLHERCFIQRGPGASGASGGSGGSGGSERRRPYVDVEMSLQYVGVKETVKGAVLTARSASELRAGPPSPSPAPAPLPTPAPGTLRCRSGSAATLPPDMGAVCGAYTQHTPTNTHRYKNASGDAMLQTNEIADVIKKMCESFTQSQERLLARHNTCDVQVQCDGSTVLSPHSAKPGGLDSEPVKLDTSKSDTHIRCEKDMVKLALPYKDRDEIMQKFVDELEDWKEKQQELFKYQLKRKEEYHLELLCKEWTKKRLELESKLSRGIEQCRTLAADLSRATDDFRLRGYRNTERERKLLDAKKALEGHYTAKYQELREASQKMEDDMNHQLKLKDMTIEEQQVKIKQLEKQLETLKNNLKNSEKEAENKYSGLTKDQTASLIQELRCLEEKLDSSVQAKQFFKEQWGRAVRELHLNKLSQRRQIIDQLTHDRRLLGEMGLDTIEDRDETKNEIPTDINKLKDDFYVDLLINTPGLDSNSISNSGPEGFDMLDVKNVPKNPTNEKINELILQRDRLIQQDSPDEATLKQLNHEIRNLLLNCGN